MQAFTDELDQYIEQVELPTGIAKTKALKENFFATIVCTVTRTPLIIVGAPGSSKTLSFNLVISNLKGEESIKEHFRNTYLFKSLDPHFYQCSHHTTSNEIQTVFSRAINRQRNHIKFKLPICCVVFMDEAGLPEESHESLKVLHYYLDRQEVSFVAITNHILDAAKTNRAVCLFRPDASEEELKTLVKGCLCTTPNNPPPDLQKDLNIVMQFCPIYIHLMARREFSQFFGLRDFIHFVNYLRRHRAEMLGPQLVMKALERNFNGSDKFEQICNMFLSKFQSSIHQVQCRGILEVLQESLEDCPQQQHLDMAETEVRYKMIIDPSEDDSLVRLLFTFGVLQRNRKHINEKDPAEKPPKETHIFVCSRFPGDSQLQMVNTVAAIRHSAIEGHTVLMTQSDDIHESFYDLLNQRFRKIEDPKGGTRYYTNIAIGAHTKPSRVDPNFQCVVVIKKSEVKKTPAPFLNRFEKYCITHHSLLETALIHLPACIKIIIQTAMEKVQDFIDLISGPHSLYGLQPETLDSLVLSMLPSLKHAYEPSSELRLKDSSLDVKVLLMQELLQNLCHCAGFYIPTCSSEELQLDIDSLFTLVCSDPEFEGLLPNLSHSAVVHAVREAINVLYTAPAHQKGAAQLNLSPEGCLVVALLQQWLVRHLCKRLMQLMTSEAFTLYRNVLPSSYLKNYLSFHSHFSLQKLIIKYSDALNDSRYPASSPTKLLCFTRSSLLIHQLPTQYPSSVIDTQTNKAAEQTLCDMVFPKPSQLVMCKLSSLLSQSSLKEILSGFVQSKTAQVCLFVVNMQETSHQVVNHLRILIEEAEEQGKLFVILLHFHPLQFFNTCYPALFLKGWDHYYLDTIAHSEVQDVVDIEDWFWQCCFPKQIPERDSLMLTLSKLLQEAVPVLSSRVFFRSSLEKSFNRPMNGLQCSKVLRELLFEKGVGEVLCQRFRSYWKPAVMAEYLQTVVTFTKDCESTLSITDSIQTKLKSLFIDFLLYLLSHITEMFNIGILFDSDCTMAVQKLFLDILHVLPLPKLSQLHVLSTRLPVPATNQSPRFPFFKVVCEAVEKIVEQTHSTINVQENLLQEKEVESMESNSFRIYDDIYALLQESVKKTIEKKMEATPKDSLVLAVRAMQLDNDLWQHYFYDFLLYKLHLGGTYCDISQQILHVLFTLLHEQNIVERLASLHCHVHVYHLNFAKMVNLLEPLNKIQQVSKHLSPMEKEPIKQLLSTIHPTSNPLGTPEHIATFVVNTLFDGILGATYDRYVPEKMTVWFKAYRDVMTLLIVKELVYVVALDQQRREGEDGKKGMDMVEARLSLMQGVFLAIQTSFSLKADVLLKAKHIFETLFNEHMTDTLKLPRLAEVTNVMTTHHLFETCSDRLLMEGLLAHFFSPYQCVYHTEDVQWFLELANKQNHWKTNLTKDAQQQPFELHQVSEGTISMCVFKYYLGRILGLCDQNNDLSGPLLLYCHQPRSQVDSVLMANPALGPPAAYIPKFYQKCSSNQRMQQPLAHLYFLTVLEHLQAKDCKLSYLLHVASIINQHCTSKATGEGESVVLRVELQAVVQLILQKLATHLSSTEPQMGEVQPLAEDINSLLDDVKMGEKNTFGHGMVLALHMVKQLKSFQKFSELLTKEHHICHEFHCLQPLREQISFSFKPKPYLLEFMLPDAKDTELGKLYLCLKEVMVGVHERKKQVESFIRIADKCTQSVQMSRGTLTHPSAEDDARVDIVDKRPCFRMMVWLCAYYEFYEKKVTSELLSNVIGNQLAPYLQDEGCIRLIQCFLDPKMFYHPESPNPLQKDSSEKDDVLHQLFVPHEDQQIDQSDIDLRHSLANLVGVILGCPSQSNHLWYHLFHPGELHETYVTGFMYNAKVNQDGFHYNYGVELTPEGQFGRQEYMKHATRGTYTLHSLYLLLWANFGTFCLALLTQPEAEAGICGPIISPWLSVRHYCATQLRTMWMHMRNNLGLSDEERSFFIFCCTKQLYEMLKTSTNASESWKGIFKTREALDSYELMWHTSIYQPSWIELKTNYSQIRLNKLFVDIRQLGLCYPHFPTEQDFIHSVISSGDIQSHAQGGELHLLTWFTRELPRLQAGGELLPHLVEFYQWLHTTLAGLVTKERAATLSISQVVKLVARRRSTKEKEHLLNLYSKVKDGYNLYMELIGGAIGMKAYAELRQGNKVFTIADDSPLLHFLSDVGAEENGNDWLYTVATDIITAHNSFIEGVYYFVQAHQQSPLSRFYPDELARVYPTEVNESNYIVGKLKSGHGISDLLQLIRSRYQSPIELPQHSSIPSGLETVKSPKFLLSLLLEDIVSSFFAGKPVIYTEPSFLRMPFKFLQSSSGVMAATDVVGSTLDMGDIAEQLLDMFKDPLEVNLQKRLEYEFHSACYHTLVEVINGLRTVAGHLVKEQESEALKQQTVAQFMLRLYDHLNEGDEMLKEIGIRSTSNAQLACLMELPLPSLFCCLQLFASWVRDGVYDYATLPFGLKIHLPYQDLQSIKRIPLKWKVDPRRSLGDLLEEIKHMNEVLKHSEAHITKTAYEYANKPITQYLREIHLLRKEDHLTKYIPLSVHIQHYVSFRIALRRLMLTVQHEVEADGGDVEEKKWSEAVNDLWDNRLPHLREEVYSNGAFVCDPPTGRYGFLEDSDFDSEGELMNDLMNAPKEQDKSDTEDAIYEDQQPSLKLEEETMRHSEEPRKEGQNTQTQEQSAQKYTPEHVGQFLKGIGLDHHVSVFSEENISGDILLEATDEMLEELGVTSATEKLKIKVLFRQSLEGGVMQYPLERVLTFLEQYKLDKYCDNFKKYGINGNLLLEADDSALEELGITSALERLKIKVLFQRSLQGGVVRYPLQTVLDFLKQEGLEKYCDTFQKCGMDGDLLLEANYSVLKELGVRSSVECIKIKTKYKNFIETTQV